MAAQKKAAKKAVSNAATPMLQQIEAAKNFKAPKDYKPLSTGEKLMMATSFVPVGRVASAAGKAVTKIAAKKYSAKAGEKVTKTFTQGKKTKITSEPPKSTGAGKSSPVKGTQTTVERTKKGQSAKQQASSNEGRKTREEINKKVPVGRAFGVGVVVGRAEERDKSKNKKK